jgi:hypothetical protein
MHTPLFFVSVAISVVSLSACNQGSSSGSTTIDQSNLCVVTAWQHDEVAKECKPSQKVAFIPNSFGNEQLPVIFAAANCDLRYNVALTTGAVTCIYGPITPQP